MADKKIHTVRVDIAGDSTKLQKASRKASQSVKGLGGSLNNLASGVAIIDGPLGSVSGRINTFRAALGRTNVVIGAGVAAFAALGAATTKGLQEFSKTEQSLFKTEALLRATGDASGFTALQLDEMARSLARATLASVDQIRSAQQVLLTFKSISGPEFERTITLAQDMASVFGGDAKSAALQLGKALEEPVIGLTALRRSGVSFSQSQKEVIKNLVETGQKAQAQQKILEALEGQVGGAGSAEGSGLAGAFDLLGQNTAEAAEQWVRLTGIGPAVTKTINSIAEAIGIANGKLAGEDYTSVVLQRFALDEQIEKKKADLENATSARQRKADKLELARLVQKYNALEDILEARTKELQLQGRAVINAENAKKEAAAEEAKARAVKSNAESLKEFKKVQDSLLTNREKENQLHISRLVQFEELAAANQDNYQLQNQIRSATEAEELRHQQKITSIRQQEQAKRNAAILGNLPDNEGLTEDFGSIRDSLGAQSARDGGGGFSQFDSIKQELEKAKLAEKEYHEGRILRLEMFREQNHELQASVNEVIAQETKRHEDKLTEIQEKASKKRQQQAEEERQKRLAVVGGMFTNLSTLTNSESKKAFKIGKIAAIANATLSGLEAIVHSYKAGAKIGGPPLGAAFAATAAAATAVQIQAIKRQQFGGGGSVTSAGTGATPVIQEPQTPVNPVENNTTGGGTNIYIGQVNGSSAVELIDELREVISQRDYIIIDPASANAQRIREAG